MDKLAVYQQVKLNFGDRNATAQSLQFLALTIDTTLMWKHHIGELTSRTRLVMPSDKLSCLCP
jgi:hypothetical protein